MSDPALAADNPLDQLDVFWTELSPNRAVVYARLTDLPYHSGWRLSGTIRGPRSMRHQTLPATIPLKDLGPGQTHLARVVVPEPSYWSPEAPNIYDVTVELHREGEPTLVEKRQLGFKPIRAGERYFLREGKPWVPRGLSFDKHNVENFSLTKAREEGLVVSPKRTFWQQASDEGCYVETMIAPSIGSVRAQLRDCAKYPAVTFVVVPYYADVNQTIPKDGHNLILLQALCRGVPYQECDWADAVAAGTWALDDSEQNPLSISKPVIIGTACDSPVDVNTARSQCDELQRKLAPLRQFAGYKVSNRS
jgi:hypothetical protein